MRCTHNSFANHHPRPSCPFQVLTLSPCANKAVVIHVQAVTADKGLQILLESEAHTKSNSVRRQAYWAPRPVASSLIFLRAKSSCGRAMTAPPPTATTSSDHFPSPVQFSVFRAAVLAYRFLSLVLWPNVYFPPLTGSAPRWLEFLFDHTTLSLRGVWPFLAGEKHFLFARSL